MHVLFLYYKVGGMSYACVTFPAQHRWNMLTEPTFLNFKLRALGLLSFVIQWVWGGSFLEVAHFTRFFLYGERFSMIWLVVLLWAMIHWLILCSHSILSHANAIRFQDSLLWLLRFVFVLPVVQYYILPLLFLSSLSGVDRGVWRCLFMAYSIWYHCMLFNGQGYLNSLFILKCKWPPSKMIWS